LRRKSHGEEGGSRKRSRRGRVKQKCGENHQKCLRKYYGVVRSFLGYGAKDVKNPGKGGKLERRGPE